MVTRRPEPLPPRAEYTHAMTEGLARAWLEKHLHSTKRKGGRRGVALVEAQVPQNHLGNHRDGGEHHTQIGLILSRRFWKKYVGVQQIVNPQPSGQQQRHACVARRRRSFCATAARSGSASPASSGIWCVSSVGCVCCVSPLGLKCH